MSSCIASKSKTMLKITIVLYLVSAAQGLSCWECENAKSNKDCLKNGKVSLCAKNQGSCQNSIRSSHGEVTIHKSCKQTEACVNNMKQNGPLALAWHPIQCSFQPQNTVCRCCCSTNKCNEHALFCRGAPAQNRFQAMEESKRSNLVVSASNPRRLRSQQNLPRSPSSFEDIDECAGINNGMGNCVHAHSCTNTIGSFICHCKKGWVGLLCEESEAVHNAPGHVHVD